MDLDEINEGDHVSVNGHLPYTGMVWYIHDGHYAVKNDKTGRDRWHPREDLSKILTEKEVE